jgi:hypothetical protein
MVEVALAPDAVLDENWATAGDDANNAAGGGSEGAGAGGECCWEQRQEERKSSKEEKHQQYMACIPHGKQQAQPAKNPTDLFCSICCPAGGGKKGAKSSKEGRAEARAVAQGLLHQLRPDEVDPSKYKVRGLKGGSC